MNFQQSTGSPSDDLRAQLRDAFAERRTDDVGRLIEELAILDPGSVNDPLPRVFWLVQGGRVREALQFLNDIGGEDAWPELRAVCLRNLGDPSWQGLAQALLENGTPVVRQAMAQLLAETDR